MPTRTREGETCGGSRAPSNYYGAGQVSI